MKKLILRYLGTKDDTVSFKIEEQSHRCGEFSDNLGFFVTSSGIDLDSVSLPAMSYGSKVFYCRGNDTLSDKDIIEVTSSTWEKIKISVKEYNKHFGYYDKCILGEVIENIVPIEMFMVD